MLKSACVAALLSLVSVALHAQPQPCGVTPEMTSFCAQACIICDIDGFTGINDDPAKGQAPPGFCTTTAHHMQWIGFIAGSTNLTLNVKVFGCQFGAGLEVGIYKSLDCVNFQLVSNCDGDIQQGETGVFKNTVPLTIGQYYYFVMDGNNGDVCQYTISVVDGTTAVAQLPTSGVLSGDFTVCPGRSEAYSLAALPGAAWFSWTLDGAPLSAGVDTSVTINWTTPGTHQLCATASNVCDTAPPSCQIIQVQAIPPTHIVASVCSSACWEGADTVLCNPGFYTFHFAGQEGCDSVVTVQLDVIPSDLTNLDLMICKGDTLQVGERPYYETGQFQELLANQYGCDSTVNLDLLVIVCEIKGALHPEQVNCNGQASGALHFVVEDGTPPFQYKWERIGAGQPFGTGNIDALNNEIDIDNLPTGTYFVTITDNFGHNLVLFGDVTEPLPLHLDLNQSDFNGFQVACPGGTDGWLQALASGGTLPYKYSWSNGAQSERAEGLPAGIYTCTVTDDGGCTATASASLSEPPTLVFSAEFTNPGCAGYNSGIIRIISATGGVTPYAYSLSGGPFSDQILYENLWYGPYTLRIQDTNGCEADTSSVLQKPLIPEIILSPDVTVELAESTPLYLLSNVPLDTIVWSPPTGLSCSGCPKPDATPYTTTTYTATVISAINGCTDTDSLTVFVLDKRDVYVPNSFSPNDDGRNDRFTVFGGPEVRLVRSLQVWSRWGELLFAAKDVAPNQENAGWDGFFRGKELPPGVFLWRAELEFVDEVVLSYQGDVTLVR